MMFELLQMKQGGGKPAAMTDDINNKIRGKSGRNNHADRTSTERGIKSAGDVATVVGGGNGVDAFASSAEKLTRLQAIKKESPT